MDGLLEYKSLVGEVKDIDTSKRVVTGYLSAFGNEDLTKDIIEQGAFTKSLNERKDQIFFLNQHNWAQPHGKFAVLQEDSKGLYFESEPLIDTSYSSDALKLYEAGILNEHSIGYAVKQAQKNTKTGIRHLKELQLFEGSNVTRGANPDTPFTGMKALTLSECNNKISKIMTALRKGNFTDDTFVLLEIALKQYQLDAYELGRKSLEEPANTIVTLEPNIAAQIEAIKRFTY